MSGLAIYVGECLCHGTEQAGPTRDQIVRGAAADASPDPLRGGPRTCWQILNSTGVHDIPKAAARRDDDAPWQPYVDRLAQASLRRDALALRDYLAAPVGPLRQIAGRRVGRWSPRRRAAAEAEIARQDGGE